MQDYDVALKLLLRQAAGTAIRMVSGVSISKWLDIELPKTQNLRMDLLGEDANGHLHHFELQSTNDFRIDLRMAEYALGIRRLTGRYANQLVLYVGQAPLRMPTELRVQQLFVLAGLRRLEQTVKEEVERMPLEIDLMENQVLGPAIRKGLEQGRAEGELRLLRLQIEKRFGSIPDWGKTKLSSLSVVEIEALAERIFDAPTIESLLN